jgi:orotate phosphoribosyltransferase
MIGAVGVLSFQAGKPVNTFIIRKTPKGHGKKQQIEGPPLKEGGRVVLIDDVATTGKAFLQSLDVLTEMGIRAEKAICIVDRGEGAKEAVAAKGCELVSIFDIGEIHQP